MRIVGFAGLVLVLLIVGFMDKRQATTATPGSNPTGPGVTSQTRQVQQNIQRSLDTAMHTPRDIPDEP